MTLGDGVDNRVMPHGNLTQPVHVSDFLFQLRDVEPIHPHTAGDGRDRRKWQPFDWEAVVHGLVDVLHTAVGQREAVEIVQFRHVGFPFFRYRDY